jgi:hypothetical protein
MNSLPDVKNIAYTTLLKKLIEIIRRYPWSPLLAGKKQFPVHGTSWMYFLEYNTPQNRSMTVRKNGYCSQVLRMRSTAPRNPMIMVAGTKRGGILEQVLVLTSVHHRDRWNISLHHRMYRHR